MPGLSDSQRLLPFRLLPNQLRNYTLCHVHFVADPPNAQNLFAGEADLFRGGRAIRGLQSKPLEGCHTVCRDIQRLLPLGSLDGQVPQQSLRAFRVGDDPQKFFFLAPCFVHPLRGSFEDTPLGCLRGSLVGIRLVAPRLRFSKQRDEQRGLRHRLQSRGDLFFPAAGRIALQADIEHIAHIRLRGQEGCRQETCREAPTGARAAGLGNTPTQNLPELPVHLPAAFHIIEIPAVLRFPKQRRTALAELLPYAPDALRFGFESHLDNWIVGAGPRDVRLVMS